MSGISRIMTGGKDWRKEPCAICEAGGTPFEIECAQCGWTSYPLLSNWPFPAASTIPPWDPAGPQDLPSEPAPVPKDLCSICKTKPHKTTCGLYSPYQEKWNEDSKLT